jgi:hypothetical protein
VHWPVILISVTNGKQNVTNTAMLLVVGFLEYRKKKSICTSYHLSLVLFFFSSLSSFPFWLLLHPFHIFSILVLLFIFVSLPLYICITVCSYYFYLLYDCVIGYICIGWVAGKKASARMIEKIGRWREDSSGLWQRRWSWNWLRIA